MNILFKTDGFIIEIRASYGVNIKNTKSNVVAEMHRGRYWFDRREVLSGIHSIPTQIKVKKPQVPALFD